MARLTPLDLKQAQALGQHFGVDISHVEALDAGSVNSNFRLKTASGATLFGRVYEEQDEAGARVEMRLLSELHSAGIPTTLPLAPVAGEALPLHDGKPFALYQWLAGEHLCLKQVTRNRAEILGQTLARVHLASAQLTPLSGGRFGGDGLRKRLQSIKDAAPAYAEDADFIAGKLTHYERQLAEGPRGLVHGDLFRDNVLWQGDRIVALLDFESASWSVFAYDVMVCLLAWCYADGFNLETASALFAGYLKERPMVAAERAQLPVQGALACLRFATTRITDFSMRCAAGETPERDYRRFLTRLRELEQGALDSVFALHSPQ